MGELRGLGHTEIQVVAAANCSSAEIHTLRLALNLSRRSTWDQDKLRTEFAELIEFGIDFELTGSTPTRSI